MTHNQIDYWKMRNEKLNNEQRNAETKRYNLVQEELKKIDQELQRNLMRINAKYKERELDLADEELKWKKRYQQTQLNLDKHRIDISKQQNSINLMSVNENKRSNIARERETNRSNLVHETIARGKLQNEKSMLPYEQSKAWSQTEVNNEQRDLIQKQQLTETTKPYESLSRTFNNIISPFINMAGGVLRAVHLK